VEETPAYIKIEGEKDPREQPKGRIFILDQACAGGLTGISTLSYDGAPLPLTDADMKATAITSRDIDRQGFSHYFLKEISESPRSVAQTLRNRWHLEDGDHRLYTPRMAAATFPPALRQALLEDRIRRIFFIGQGTAGVAAAACAEIFNYYLNDPRLHIGALKASELSGFRLNEEDGTRDMTDTLVVAITQSGTTTDTNRTVDMVREKGAYTLAVVNRRDSDITFKVDGVFYTSSGRDVEMSVASTKAFYSQIVAGALLGLTVADVTKRRDKAFISREIENLLRLPDQMKKVLSTQEQIAASAARLAVTKTYWAVVGSGPNKVSADEIRIKLSELCYKTISSDYVEDKKHIDLSAEPLIIVCAAGTKSTVIGDIVKDTAIFHAHKATPVVITDEGDHRFDPYAADVFHVPMVGQHLAPILNTLVGHIWGYYAALAINEGSRFLFDFRADLQHLIDDHATRGLDIYELVLEKSFREKIAAFYHAFRKKKARRRLPSAVGFDTASELPLLLKYLTGRLPVTDFELDFGIKGTASNMLHSLFHYLGDAINQMARPVDAIKHQAKTVTVGTSRIREKVEGILFDALFARRFNISQITNKNILVLKNLQAIIHSINGSTLYRIHGLNLLGEPADETTIEMVAKEGTSQTIPSRIEKDATLKGTKRIIVREGNVYIGKGRKDDRSILIIPIISLSSDRPNFIEYLLLLDIAFKKEVSLPNKIKALGGKYERIKNIVQENSLSWEDAFLDGIEVEELFGRSAEKVGEQIVGRFKNSESAQTQGAFRKSQMPEAS
jgi:glucosamine--fructose-6-phosphate aminotransferase (isomerizing)